MTEAVPTPPHRTHEQENFPVASRLIRPRYRAAILAFYNFVRAADDIADSPVHAAAKKIALLDRLEADLIGGTGDPRAKALRRALDDHHLDERHALDLLAAFRLDATKSRYADWEDLIGYCRLSAMPVGRFVLDLHGESRATWPTSDALCAALQIINHLQDCGDDFRALDRVYLPLDVLSARGARVEALGAPAASPELRACIVELARRCEALLAESAGFAPAIADWRLSLEVAVIQKLALRLARGLTLRDPLADETHFGKLAAARIAIVAILEMTARRLGVDRRQPALGAPK
jgi:squalene synthase HpnC